MVKEEATGSGFPFVLGKLADLPKADLVLVVGTDVTPEMPPLGWKLMEAKENENFRLVVANPRKTKFDRYADLSLRYKPGSERVLIAGLIKFFLADNPDWTPAIKASGLDELKESIKLTPKEITTKTGVEEAALKEVAALLAQAQAPAIVFGTELLSQDKGQQTALALADLFLLVGKPDAPGSALYPVAEKNNSRGVSEVGVLPDMGPGYVPVEGHGARPHPGRGAGPPGERRPRGPQGLVSLGRGPAAVAPASQPGEKAPQESAVYRGAGRLPHGHRQAGPGGLAGGGARRAGRHLHQQHRAVGVDQPGPAHQRGAARLADHQPVGGQDGVRPEVRQPQGDFQGTGEEDAPVGRVGAQVECAVPEDQGRR